MSARLAFFLRDPGGGAIPLFAVAILVLFGFGAMAVDIGSFFHEKRRLRSANDLAALAAASDLPRHQAAAQASAALNGFPATAIRSIRPGLYRADPALPVGQRFTTESSSPANAIRIDMESSMPVLLGRVLSAFADNTANATSAAPAEQASTDTGRVRITSSAIAVQDSQAAFAIGSRLARLEGGILNGLIGALLGGSVTLSVMDYEALIQARVDLFTFAKRLAIRSGLSVANYDDVLRAGVTVGDILLASQDAAREHASRNQTAIDALGRLAGMVGTPSGRVTLAPLVSFGLHGPRSLSEPNPLSASLSALDLVNAIAQIANGSRQIEIGLAATLPGIAAATLRLGIGERPVGTSLVAVGRLGASVHTAQTRLLLTVDLVGSGQASLVRLPLYLELAPATARLSAIQCRPGDIASSRVTLSVRPGVVDAWIGQVSAADFSNYRSAPNPPAATLLNLAGLAKVSGRAHATISNLAETPVAFSHADIQKGEKRTTSTQDFVASLLSRLVADLELKVEVLGLGLPIPGLGSAVGGVIAGAVAPLDQLLDAVLGALGLGLGQADSQVSGVRCGGSVLVR